MVFSCSIDLDSLAWLGSSSLLELSMGAEYSTNTYVKRELLQILPPSLLRLDVHVHRARGRIELYPEDVSGANSRPYTSLATNLASLKLGGAAMNGKMHTLASYWYRRCFDNDPDRHCRVCHLPGRCRCHSDSCSGVVYAIAIILLMN